MLYFGMSVSGLDDSVLVIFLLGTRFSNQAYIFIDHSFFAFLWHCFLVTLDHSCPVDDVGVACLVRVCMLRLYRHFVAGTRVR